MERFLMLFVIFFPALCALLMPLVKAEKGKKALLVCALALEAAAVCVLLPSKGAELTLFSMTPALTAHLRMDDISRLFMTVAAFGFLFAGVYAMSSKYDFQWDRDINLQGEYWSAGVSAGYAMPIGRRKRVNLEFSLAVGPMHTVFRHYQPTQSYDKLIRDPYNAGIDYKTGQWYFGPTKAKISLVVPINVPTGKKEVRYE